MKKLLLVDNRPSSAWADILKKALNGLAEVSPVHGKEIARKLQGAHFDLALINAANVPNVVRTIRRVRGGGSGIPVVVLTASPDVETAREVIRAGAANYLPLSVDEKEIRNSLSELLERSNENDRGVYGKPYHPAG
jgi:DNA-binding NtrC family response regulator